MTDETSFSCWAVIDLFGHTRIAGMVTEKILAGHGFIRVDVPQVNGQPPFTRFLGSAAIYSITPVSEEIARKVAGYVRSRPVQVYIGEDHQIEIPFDGDDDEDDS